MAVSLRKGQKVNLKKDAPNLKRVLVGLGWDPIQQNSTRSFLGFGGEANMDIDASVICIKKDESYDNLLYFANRRLYSGAILHHGDNLTGDGDGDDEQIEIYLDEVPSEINRCAIIINIYSAYRRKQHFGKVRNCFVHVLDMDTNKELVRYDVDGNFDGQTGIFVADIYRHNGEWKFQAIGEGVKVRDIEEMVHMKCRQR